MTLSLKQAIPPYNYIEHMKNLRIAKKNPSKILKIIDIQPATYRYNTNNQQISVSFRAQPTSLASHSKEYKNIESHRQRSLRHSPSRSQRIIDIKSNPKNRKIRNRSLGSSQEALKNEVDSSSLLKFRNSHEIRSKKEHSPYIRRSKFRQSEKLLNFHSVSLGDKVRKEEKGSEKEPSKNGTRRRSVLLKADHIEDTQTEQRAHIEIIENAKKFLGQGQYRKSLLVIKNILQSNPNHIEALYLSAVNWYHLEDRIKTILFLQQIFTLNLTYSPECFKMAAVCYSKAFEYNKSLTCLANCHKYFPDEVESYDLEGRILGKVHKWEEAEKVYQRGYEISKNVSFLVNKAQCHEELNQTALALECYEQVIASSQVTLKIALRKMRLNLKGKQYQEIIHTYDLFACMRDQKQSKERDEFYYLVSYSYYKLHKFSFALVTLDQGLDNCINPVKFHKILLMIRIHERDIYQAYHLVSTIRAEPQIRVIMKFIEGVIELMRRNHQQGVDSLLSIQSDLGFRLQFTNSIGKERQQKGEQVHDQFLNEIRQVYLMFLSYGYYSVSQFHICRKLFKIQKILGIPGYFQLGFEYNFQMCEGIISHCEKDFLIAEAHFQRASTMYENKLEPHFSLALNCLQIMVNSSTALQKAKHADKARQYFQVCQRIVGKQASNTAAGVYYFSSLLQGYMQEWKDALDCIDQSIERSQDHYWRYFYVRGLLLSCIHSFRQAVNDLSLAIALSGTTRPECYLLRSKCLQIQGEGNQAFKDLQEYISLKPDDPEVHKFAGQLLFENGAFEDALVAFSHQPIHLVLENYDIFLTKGKSLFLLGRFKAAYEEIQIAQDLKYSSQVEFDLKVIDILDILVNKTQTSSEISAKLEQIYARKDQLGRIFKLSDYHILKAVCCTYQASFQAAISQFLLAIQQKSIELGQSQEIDESGMIENKKDMSTFTNQMRYNIVLCRLSLGQYEEAASVYKLISVDFDQPFYGDFINFKKFINREVQTYKKEEVFPSRNKLSNFLQKVKLTIDSKNGTEKTTIMLKLCIPFPKVEPPEIFPTFDSGLLVRLSVLNVERKPQAPWVLRQNNSIKFTDKIETFSRFQLQDSDNDSCSTYQIASIDQSHISPSQRSRRLRTSEHKPSEVQGRISRLEK